MLCLLLSFILPSMYITCLLPPLSLHCVPRCGCLSCWVSVPIQWRHM
jgi:hypothetical protein